MIPGEFGSTLRFARRGGHKRGHNRQARSASLRRRFRFDGRSMLVSTTSDVAMDVRAKITSKGRVTIPKPVRDALALQQGDELLLRVEDSRIVVTKAPDLTTMAGSMAVPLRKRATPWDEVLRETRRARAERRR
jgi:antitoxin PrlF